MNDAVEHKNLFVLSKLINHVAMAWKIVLPRFCVVVVTFVSSPEVLHKQMPTCVRVTLTYDYVYLIAPTCTLISLYLYI